MAGLLDEGTIFAHTSKVLRFSRQTAAILSVLSIFSVGLSCTCTPSAAAEDSRAASDHACCPGGGHHQHEHQSAPGNSHNEHQQTCQHCNGGSIAAVPASKAETLSSGGFASIALPALTAQISPADGFTSVRDLLHAGVEPPPKLATLVDLFCCLIL